MMAILKYSVINYKAKVTDGHYFLAWAGGEGHRLVVFPFPGTTFFVREEVQRLTAEGFRCPEVH